MLLLRELHIDVADHVIGEIIADVEALDVAVLIEFFKQVLVEILEVVLDLARVKGLGLGLGVNGGSQHVRSLVHVGKE